MIFIQVYGLPHTDIVIAAVIHVKRYTQTEGNEMNVPSAFKVMLTNFKVYFERKRENEEESEQTLIYTPIFLGRKRKKGINCLVYLLRRLSEAYIIFFVLKKGEYEM